MAKERPLKPERWRTVEEIFHTVIASEASQRQSVLARACAGDESLRSEVESLVHYSESARSTLETPGFDLIAQALANEKNENNESGAPEKLIGKRIASYQITSPLGQGGMGLVYRAIRSDDAYKKEVAIKLVRPGLDTDTVYRRFRSERQILAALEHENIARLLDGGTTEDGGPYFVMELVTGQPIDEYCDHRKLSVVDRVRLFQSVCSAVQYAHQHLVVHRDIKPKNILVTAEGIPKLLDFGIATILSPETVPGSDPTLTVASMMTPEYASPEQLRSEPITTATDVYSLGLVLYKLLSGRTPYRPAGDSAYDLAHAICQEEPDKPSTAIHRPERITANARSASDTAAVISASRSTTPDKLQRTLSGDLDQVLLKALRKEPRERYPSVQSFAQDLRSYLARMPVSARRGTFIYRANKFIKRNKLPLAAAALVLVMTLAGIAAIVREVRIARSEKALAEKRFNDVRALANSLLFDVHDAIQDLPGTTPARKLLVERALKYLDGLSLENTNDASLKAESAAAYEKIGDVQGNPDFANLGDTAGALKSYRHALEIRQSINASGSDANKNQLGMVADHEKLGYSLFHVNDVNRGLEHLREAVRINRDLAQSASTSAPRSALTDSVQDSSAGAYFQLARGLAGAGYYAEARDNYLQSARIREAQHNDSPAIQARIETRLAGTYGHLSGTLSRLGDLNQAITMQTKSRDIMQGLSQAAPQNASYREYLSEGNYWVGYYQMQAGRFPEARQNYENALSGFDTLSTADPSDTRTRANVAMCNRGLGIVFAVQGKDSQGLSTLNKSLVVYKQLAAADPSSMDKLGDVADTQSAIADIYLKLAKAGVPSKPSTMRNWQAARSWSQQTLNSFAEVQRRGPIFKNRATEPDRLKQNIALCDRMLHTHP